MGAWGAGSFDNDAAMDFVGEIESVAELEGAFVASNAQGHVLIEDELDADMSCRILVAAECVAAMRGHRLKDMPDDLAKKVHGFGKPSRDLHELAKNNVSAVVSRSELAELWAESEDKGDFNRAVTDLIDRLCLEPKSARKPRKRKAPFNNSPCAFCGKPMGETEGSMFDFTVSTDEISSLKLGGWAHIACLNAALHPKHILQNWRFDGAELDAEVERILGRGVDD